ncbi:MAG: hypothetical protein AAF441_01105 [Pseudomonadota bacterium]
MAHVNNIATFVEWLERQVEDQRARLEHDQVAVDTAVERARCAGIGSAKGSLPADHLAEELRAVLATPGGTAAASHTERSESKS